VLFYLCHREELTSLQTILNFKVFLQELVSKADKSHYLIFVLKYEGCSTGIDLVLRSVVLALVLVLKIILSNVVLILSLIALLPSLDLVNKTLLDLVLLLALPNEIQSL